MQKLRGRPFEPGNKVGRGRPHGSRNKANPAWRQLLEEHSESLVRKCIVLAMQGNHHALRLCMERIGPVRRDEYIRLKLPPTHTIEDVSTATRRVVQQVAAGNLTPVDGEIVMRLLEGQRNSIETEALQARVQRLENSVTQKSRR